MSRCSGHCCEVIRIPYSIAELRAGRSDKYRGELVEGKFLGEILEPTGKVTDDGGHVYRCTKFVGGECTIYAHRPTMCADFPYGRPCPYPDECTWEAGRNGTVPATVHLPTWQPGADLKADLPFHRRMAIGKTESTPKET